MRRSPFVRALIGTMILGAGAANAQFFCKLNPWDSTDTGLGAGLGENRTFASAPLIPSECMSAGSTWIAGLVIEATRAAAGDPDMPLRFGLLAGPLGGPPELNIIDPVPVVLSGVPVFPLSQEYQLSLADIFTDGFESGDALRWSSTAQPRVPRRVVVPRP